MRYSPRLLVGVVGVGLSLSILAAACSASKDDDPPADDGSGASMGVANGGAGGIAGSGGSTATGQGGELGLGGNFGAGGSGQGPVCKVPPDGEDAVVPTCDDVAPADSFDPVVQWSWNAPPAMAGSLFSGSFITPLVGNFTDDDNNGEIDLCDTPDVLISVVDNMTFNGAGLVASSKLFLLSGDTGQQITEFPILVDGFVTPAFADIDGDMLPEVIAADTLGRVVAFEHDGTVKWTGDTAGYLPILENSQCPTIGLYDLDNDGDVEIILSFEVFDHLGNRLWGHPGNGGEFPGQYWCVTPTAADLDGDDDLEVLFGHVTYQHDGTLFWQTGETPSHPHVANLDNDLDPEVFLTNQNGIMVVEHDGTPKFGPIRPTDPTPAANCWGKPSVVHDFDGNGTADIAASTCTDYTVYNVGTADLTISWTNNVGDLSGLATATAFDFLGDASSEAIYADETQIYVFDGLTGITNLTAPRSSGTLIEYPVVADVDNDGSAEIIYVSNYAGGMTGPTVVVLGDMMDRWIPARRIWNQYSYHVTNVREDATIAPIIKKSWLNLNTFRTNSQISEEGDCDPDPPQ